jgi:hypothetical protein
VSLAGDIKKFFEVQNSIKIPAVQKLLEGGLSFTRKATFGPAPTTEGPTQTARPRTPPNITRQLRRASVMRKIDSKLRNKRLEVAQNSLGGLSAISLLCGMSPTADRVNGLQ